MATEDVTGADLGGAEQLMRTSPAPQPPSRKQHPLDGRHGFNLSHTGTTGRPQPSASAGIDPQGTNE